MQFDVYENENPKTKERIPYLLDIQSEILSMLDTRVVVPLVINVKSAKHLNPIFQINGKSVVMSTAQLTAVPSAILNTKITNLSNSRAEILNAIDFLLTGV